MEDNVVSLWEKWVEEGHAKLESLKLLHSLRPIHLRNEQHDPNVMESELQGFGQMHDPLDRSSVQIQISEATFQNWLHEVPSSAAVIVARKEAWHRSAIWDRVQDFRDLTGIPITSHIISLVVGSEDKPPEASRHLLKSGFHVVAMRPPIVPPNSCRLRVSLNAAHTRNDMERLAAALSSRINFKVITVKSSNRYSRM